QPPFTWSSTGLGSVNTNTGLYIAPATGAGLATINANSGGVTGAATVDVVISGTLTVHSLAGDGRGAHSLPRTTQSAWDTAHDATSGIADYTTANRTNWVGSLNGGGSSTVILRGYLAFDTSSLPKNAIVTSATVGVYITGKTDNLSDGKDFI